MLCRKLGLLNNTLVAIDGSKFKAADDSSFTFKFGDTEPLCNELLRLIRLGDKTATREALSAFEVSGEAMPIVGRRDTALNWNGTPALLLETLEVFQMRFATLMKAWRLRRRE